MGALHRGILPLLPIHILVAQISSFPYLERFDSVQTPALPPGWETSASRLATGDFFSTTTSARSSPFAVQSTNSTIAQTLISPIFDFTSFIPDKLDFYIARSGTHTSNLLIEASLDNGSTWPLTLGDTLRHPGSSGYMRTTLQLPNTLANQSCRFRWRILGGTGGSTGTFRIDDISLTVLTPYDLTVTLLSFRPESPTYSDQLTLNATVQSSGVLPASQYAVDFFLDLNEDGIGEQMERFASATGPPIAPGDSLQLWVIHAPLAPGAYRFLCVAQLPEDENTGNDTAYVIAEIGAPPGSIIINEIMYAPAGDEPEWLEFLNVSEVPVNLMRWNISDNRITAKTILSFGDFIAPPGGFVLVAKDSGYFSVHDTIQAPVSISNFPALNNTTPDAVVLYDTRGITIDSVGYDPLWGAGTGQSLERIDPLSNSNDAANWIPSLSPTRSTPGRPNSLAIRDVDVRFKSVFASGTTIFAHLANAGRETVGSFGVLLWSNQDGETTGIGTMVFSGILTRGDSAFLSYNWLDAPSGRTAVVLQIDLPGDQRLENNTDTVEVIRQFKQSDVVINEIMFEPLSDQNEWVELANLTAKPVDLAGWKISDAPTASGNTNKFAVVGPNSMVEPGGFKILVAESTFFSLFPHIDAASVILFNRAGGFSFGNEGDAVILTDLIGTVIDSLWYSPSWHHPKVKDTRGRSLERIRPDLPTNDPRSWGTSSANSGGGSPGQRNSIFTASTPSTSSLSFSPNPFSPDGDGHEDFCAVRFNIPNPSSVVRIRIFDLGGRLIRTLADGEPFGPEGEVLWDGMESSRRKARIGPHIVLLEASGSDGSVFSARGVVVVAARL